MTATTETNDLHRICVVQIKDVLDPYVFGTHLISVLEQFTRRTVPEIRNEALREGIQLDWATLTTTHSRDEDMESPSAGMVTVMTRVEGLRVAPPFDVSTDDVASLGSVARYLRLIEAHRRRLARQRQLDTTFADQPQENTDV